MVKPKTAVYRQRGKTPPPQWLAATAGRCSESRAGLGHKDRSVFNSFLKQMGAPPIPAHSPSSPSFQTGPREFAHPHSISLVPGLFCAEGLLPPSPQWGGESTHVFTAGRMSSSLRSWDETWEERGAGELVTAQQ